MAEVVSVAEKAGDTRQVRQETRHPISMAATYEHELAAANKNP
jgi:hypothetical protein